jgi:hypothetical protein
MAFDAALNNSMHSTRCLRRAVESLLKSHEEADNLIDTPETTADRLAEVHDAAEYSISEIELSRDRGSGRVWRRV